MKKVINNEIKLIKKICVNAHILDDELSKLVNTGHDIIAVVIDEIVLSKIHNIADMFDPCSSVPKSHTTYHKLKPTAYHVYYK